jgi:hypothetical protein
VDRSLLFAIGGTLGGLLALAAAVFLYRTAPDRQVARRFAVLLVLETVMLWTSRAGPLYWIEPVGIPRSWLLVHFANDGLLLAAYLPALAVLLRTRFLRIFESTRVYALLIGLAVLNAGVVLLFPDLYLRGLEVVTSPQALAQSVGPGVLVLFSLLTASYLAGLIITLLARHSARGPVARRRATLLALAFGVRDATWGSLYLMSLITQLRGQASFLESAPWLISAIPTIGLVLYVALMAYGIASASLFDIDLRLKWTLERGTVAAIFVAVFFVVSEGAASFLSDRLGTVLGLLSTGALVLALAPLQRAAESLADRAMPSVQDTPDYASFRKLQIYAEAIAEAMRGDEISAVDRAVLRRLRDQLQLPEQEALALEAELVSELGASAQPRTVPSAFGPLSS